MAVFSNAAVLLLGVLHLEPYFGLVLRVEAALVAVEGPKVIHVFPHVTCAEMIWCTRVRTTCRV